MSFITIYEIKCVCGHEIHREGELINFRSLCPSCEKIIEVRVKYKKSKKRSIPDSEELYLYRCSIQYLL